MCGYCFCTLSLCVFMSSLCAVFIVPSQCVKFMLLFSVLLMEVLSFVPSAVHSLRPSLGLEKVQVFGPNRPSRCPGYMFLGLL